MKKKIIIFLAVLKIAMLINIVFADSFDDWFEFGAADEEAGVSEEELGSVYMSGESLNGDLLKLSINAKDFIKPVLGIAFHLNYDLEKLSFLRYEPGDFLEKGGDPFYLVEDREDKGKIIFGETLRRGDNFPQGSGALAMIYFQKKEKGEYNFEFEQGVVSTLDEVRQDLDRVTFENYLMDSQNQSLISPANINNSISQLAKNKGINWFIFAVMLTGAIILAVFLGRKLGNNRRGVSVNFK